MKIIVNTKWKKFLYDLFYNIFSYGLSIILLQFIILPFLAKGWTEEYYGTVLLITGIVTIAVSMVSVTTANVRLIVEKEYQSEHIVGDFNRIVCELILIGVCILTIILLVFLKQNILDVILILIYFVSYAVASYLTVGYKLNCNFKNIMINNIILCLGYIAGMALYAFCGRWQIIYIVAVTCAGVHSFLTTDIRRETFKKTYKYKDIWKRILSLNSSEAIGTSLSYFDRLCLYPMIGSGAVANYQVATTFGKALNLFMTPVNMVILAHLSKKESISRKLIYRITSFLFVISLWAFGITKLVGYKILQVLYPGYAENVKNLVLIATSAIVILVCSSLLRTFAIRYMDGKIILKNEK